MEQKSDSATAGSMPDYTLGLIEELWRRLAGAPWNTELGELLARLARRLLVRARHQGDAQLEQRAAKLDRLLGPGRRPDEAQAGQMSALLQELAGAPGTDRAAPTLATAMTEVIVAGDRELEPLIDGLQYVGFRARHLSNLDEVEATLVLAAPMALIIEVDFPDAPLAGIKLVDRLRSRSQLTVPVFFVAERDDVVDRLAAVRAGGRGYYVKPVDVPVLLERLQSWLFEESAPGYHRILVVDDDALENYRMISALQAQAMITRSATQPAEALRALREFKPDLVLLSLDLERIDLELGQINGLELARLLRQQAEGQERPMLLLAAPPTLKRFLPQLEDDWDDLLIKPLVPEQLSWIVRQHLRRQRETRTRLGVLSHQGAISGLYYRRYFLAQLERTLSASGRKHACSVAVMLIVLENLRAVCQAADVAVTDELMGWAASRLKMALGADYRSAWFGEDVFAVLLTDVDREALLRNARAVRSALEGEICEVGGHRVRLRTCIGIGVATAANRDAPGLIRYADLACGLAREFDGERIHIYDPHADQPVEASYEQRLLGEIQEAVEAERLNLMFQPVVSLRGDPVERYEVLLRLRDGEDRELLPEAVFGAVQHHPLGVTLDRWVLERAIRLLFERRDRIAPTYFFINVSPVSLRDEALHAWLRERLEEVGLPGKRLIFEVAEPMARRHLPELNVFMRHIGPLGCGLSLERFGLEEGSLELLDALKVDHVKLDNAFVQELAGSLIKQTELKELLGSLQQRGVTVIVTGVEAMQALPVLWSYGIDYVQGHFLQPPHETMSFDFRGKML